jgi:flagellar biogenesis protein FliO
MEMIQQSLAVLAVLSLLAVTLWWLRRKGFAQAGTGGRRRSARRLQVLERLPLTPQHSLHLVRAPGKAVLLSSSPGGCSVIGSWEWKDFQASVSSGDGGDPAEAVR